MTETLTGRRGASNPLLRVSFSPIFSLLWQPACVGCFDRVLGFGMVGGFDLCKDPIMDAVIQCFI